MKTNIALTIISILFLNTVFAQGLIKYEKAKKIKEGKVIVVADGKAGAALNKAVAAFWTYNKVSGSMSFDAALDAAKSDESTYLMQFRRISGADKPLYASGSGLKIEDITSAYTLEINKGNGMIPAIHAFIPWNDTMRDEIAYFAVSSLQGQLEAAYNSEKNGDRILKDAARRNLPLLKADTLYIWEKRAAPGKKGTTADLAAMYSGKVKFVSYETWKKAILSREKGIAYHMSVPVANGPDYVYDHYLMDAETGKILGIVNPKVAVSGMGLPVNKDNSPDVNNITMQKFEKIYNGKGD